MKKKLVLFICTGNTCRSPMAAGYFRKLLEERGIREIDVRSAGVMTITGLLASQEAVQVMEEVEVDLKRHRSTQLTPELIRKADLILAMSPFHRQTALRMCEEAKNKTFLFKEFTKSDLKNVQIADPMGCTLEVFKKCFKEIKVACEKLVDHVFVTGPRQQMAKPATKSSAKPAGKSAAKGGAKGKPAAKSAAKPAGKPAAKPSAKPASKSATAKPAAKGKPAAKPAPEKKSAKPATAPARSARGAESGGRKVAEPARGDKRVRK